MEGTDVILSGRIDLYAEFDDHVEITTGRLTPRIVCSRSTGCSSPSTHMQPRRSPGRGPDVSSNTFPTESERSRSGRYPWMRSAGGF